MVKPIDINGILSGLSQATSFFTEKNRQTKGYLTVTLVLLTTFILTALVLSPATFGKQQNTPQAKGLQQLTLGQSFNKYPNYWPQKDAILFTSDRRGNQDIFAYFLNTGEIKPIITSRYPDRMPSVSPDGQFLVFVRERKSQTDLYKYSLDSRQILRLTSGSGNKTQPSWASGGEWIYFQTNTRGNWDIHRISSSGKHRTAVVETKAAEKEPTASEENLFYVSSKGREDFGYSLWRSNLKGRKTVKLTSNKFSCRNPNWIETESAILMAGNKSGDMDMDLWMSDFRGEELLRLTSTPSSETYPGFAFKSGQIFFSSDRTFNTHLWKIDYIKTRASNLLGELSKKIGEAAFEEGIQNIGIFKLNNYSMLKGNQLSWIQDHLAHSVINEGTLNVVDRSHLKKILEELNYNQSDMVDPDKRVEVGKMARVEAFVHGGVLDFIYKNSQTTLLYLKLIEAGTSEVIWSYLGTAKGNPNPLLFNKVKSKLSRIPLTFSVAGETKRINNLALWKNQSSSISEKYLDYITEYGLLKETSFKVSDRSSLDYVLREKGLQYEGLIDPNQTSQLEVLPIGGIFFGKVLRDEAKNLHYFLKLIDVENGSLLWSREIKIKKDKTRLHLLQAIADRVVKGKASSKRGILDMVEDGETVSVLPMKKTEPLSAQVLENQILNKLLKANSLRVINRKIIQKYLSEEKQKGTDLGLDRVAQVGEQVGIDVFLEVKFSSVGETYARGLVKAIDVETAKYVGSAQFRVSIGNGPKCDNIGNYYDEMKNQLNQGSYRSAAKLATNVLSLLNAQCKKKIDEYYQRTLRSLGIAQYYLSNYRRAGRRLNRHVSSVGIENTNPRALYCLGDIRFRRKQYQRAKKLFKVAVDKNKNFFEAYARLGDLYRKNRDYAQAITSYDNIPSNSKIYGKILIKKALTYEEFDNPGKAEELYKEATRFDDVKESAYRNLGIMYYNRGLKLYKRNEKYKAEERFGKAEDYFEKVLNLNPQAKLPYRALKNIYSKLDVPNSWENAIKLVAEKEKSIGATSKDYYFAGQMHLKFYKKYYEEGKREKARESMKKAKKSFKQASERNKMDGLLTEKHIKIIQDILQD